MTCAQDKLADYEAMRNSMLDFLWSLRRGKVASSLDMTVSEMIISLEYSLGLNYFGKDTPSERIADFVLSDNRPAATLAIDEHFATDIKRLRDL